MAADHTRLDELLNRATAAPGRVEPAPYGEFRRGLLRHISMEEKILLPAAQRLNDDQPLAAAARLRLDHGALAALLVPSPTPQIVAALKTILTDHNQLEEATGGVYDTLDEMAAGEAEELIVRLQQAPLVPVSPFNDGPKVMPATRRALARAGYENLLPE
jgi:hypothetical protein